MFLCGAITRLTDYEIHLNIEKTKTDLTRRGDRFGGTVHFGDDRVGASALCQRRGRLYRRPSDPRRVVFRLVGGVVGRAHRAAGL